MSGRRKNWRPFKEAREFARGLELKNGNEWTAYCSSGDKPDDIPARPNKVYRNEWQGWSDWLGNRKAGDWRPFKEAREFARGLGLKSSLEWREFSKSDDRPSDIPSNPHHVYRNEWEGYGDWLGTGTVAPWDHVFRPFKEAREHVRKLEIKTHAEWAAYCKSGKKPADIPSAPSQHYSNEWKGWDDWLGRKNWRLFEEAREFVRGLGLKNRREWVGYCRSGKKPDDIPANPNSVYANEWTSWGDWLGTGTIHVKNRKVRPFTEAREYVRGLRLKDYAEWASYSKSGKRPEDIPASPNQRYADEWNGWGDWLGNVNQWSKRALLALLESLRPRLPYLEEKELYTILQQDGAMRPLRAAFGNSSPMQVLKDLRENDGHRLEKALKQTPEEEAVGGEDDTVVAESGNLDQLSREHVFEDPEGITDMNGLPMIATKDGLHTVDGLSELVRGFDDEVAEYLVTNRVSALWTRYINEGSTAVHDALRDDGGYWFSTIKSRFLSELREVESLEVPKEWSFRVNGTRTPPNAMQLRTAWSALAKKRVGNWSGVGAGKTLSGVLASRVVGARATLVITNKATVNGWLDQILAAFPHRTGSRVYTQVCDGLDRRHFNYLVLNYEKFQTANRDHLVNRLADLGIDFVIFDEVQLVKQRDAYATKRRKALEALISTLGERNPELRVLGMSATPVINNLLEARKLLEIVTGVKYPELDTKPTVNNALAVHRALMLHGFRYHPRYEQEMRVEVVKTTRNELREPLRDVQGSVLSVERLLLPAKLDSIRSYFRKGVIVYTHYVDGMVPLIRHYLEDMGFKVGLYTGDDKSGIQPFLNREVDILVGSKPVGTGLDGLQSVCDRIVMLCLPWTSAEYEQIIGRVRRQGSSFNEVDIIVPQVELDHEGDTWSWDAGRMAVIHYKRTLSDCAVDGYIPETVRINENELLKQSREALDRWIARIEESGPLAIERERLTVPLPPDIRYKAQVRYGDFSTLNQRWNTSRSDTTHARLKGDPSEWYLYHTLYREASGRWPEQPAQRIASNIKVRPEWVVGDFGCGECLLKEALPNNKVIGFDHVAARDDVISCDMASTPLEDGSLDGAVFSLSLMGTNWADYLKEARRTLKPYGHLFIAEPAKKWAKEKLKAAIEDAGFSVVGDVDQRYDFLYATAVRA